jgi:hypothetical protein
MRNSHKQIVGVAVITLGVLAVAPAHSAPQMGQQPAMGETDPELDRAQQRDFDAWPQERKSAYEAWPGKTKQYFWTLTPERREMFWRLSDADKVTLSEMTDAQRENAWSRIEGWDSQARPGD